MAKSILKYVYLVEFNRCKGDSINKVSRKLRNEGYEVKKIRHKTTILVKRPSGCKLSRLKEDIANLVQDKIGSAILASSSGKMWQLDNTGNQPGVFQVLDGDDF